MVLIALVVVSLLTWTGHFRLARRYDDLQAERIADLERHGAFLTRMGLAVDKDIARVRALVHFTRLDATRTAHCVRGDFQRWWPPDMERHWCEAKRAALEAGCTPQSLEGHSTAIAGALLGAAMNARVRGNEWVN